MAVEALKKKHRKHIWRDVEGCYWLWNRVSGLWDWYIPSNDDSGFTRGDSMTTANSFYWGPFRKVK